MRVLALDVGDRRIGVALSDPTGLIAGPLTVIYRMAERRDHQTIAELAGEHSAELIVVGLPKTLAGDIGLQAQRVLRFGERLAQVVEVPIAYWDERHSTVDAERIVRAREGRRSRRQRAAVDDVAAAVILQSYLDAKRAANSEQRTANSDQESQDE